MKKGFTLIELLMGIAIMSIIFLIGFASFREFSRRQALEGVIKKAKSDLRLAQSLALTGQKPSTGTCTQLDGYTFSITGSTTYKITANCTDNPSLVIKKVTFPTGVTISGQSIKFKALGDGTNLDSDTQIIFSSAVSGGSAIVSVGKGGDIK